MTRITKTPSIDPRVAPTMVSFLLEFDAGELVAEGVNTGGELDDGSEGEGRNEEVALVNNS